MVRKFVFVEGAEPRVSPRGGERPPNANRTNTAAGPMGAALQWALLGAALAISALAFSAAKASFERQPSQAAADR